MNTVRRRLLAGLQPKQVAYLRSAAIGAALQLDDLICALLNRTSSPGAVAAANTLRATGVLRAEDTARLADWPETCTVCQRDARFLGPCAGSCGRAVCHVCAAETCDFCQRKRLAARLQRAQVTALEPGVEE